MATKKLIGVDCHLFTQQFKQAKLEVDEQAEKGHSKNLSILKLLFICLNNIY
ncbi:hypothetical protein RintRC_2970 [Richelia intracellularis]|nr:hypothetical protein RintRC_2970 [Richelia intracellularis]